MTSGPQRSRRWLVALLVAGALVRLVVLPLRGTIDVQTQKLWSFGAAGDLTGVYGVGGQPPERRLIHWLDLYGRVDYPPLALIELGVVGRAYKALRPDYPDSTLLTVLIKTPGLIAEAIFVAVLLLRGRRWMSAAAAEWAALAFWLNPAVWFTGPALGYVDAQGAVPAALALVAAAANAPATAGVLLAVGVATKPQTVFIAPIVAVVLIGSRRPLRWRRLGVAVGAGALASLAIVAPFVLRGAGPNMVLGVSRLLHHDMLSGQAANLGWIGTWLLRVKYAIADLGWHDALSMPIRILQISRVLALGYPNPRVIGTALTLAAVVWATWRAARGVSLAGAAALAAWALYAYTIVGVPVHENHFYPAVPLLALAAAALPELRAVFWTSSAVFAFNIYLFYGLGDRWPPLISRSWTFIDMTVLVAVANVVVFVWATERVARATARPPAAPRL